MCFLEFVEQDDSVGCFLEAMGKFARAVTAETAAAAGQAASTGVQMPAARMKRRENICAPE